MATSSRTKLAAVLGAAVLSASAPAEAEPASGAFSRSSEPTHSVTAESVPPAEDTLKDVIETKLQQAQGAGRYGDIEQLGTLWMTLKQRSQLDRQVTSGERFIAAALRNQRMSAYRQAARVGRFVPTADTALDNLADDHGLVWRVPAGSRSPDERLTAAELLGQLEEPYRTAVVLSAEGLNRREVAEQMGVSHAAVRKWMQRLRSRLDGADSDFVH